MIVAILKITLLVYLVITIVTFGVPLIVGLSVDGIKGIEDMLGFIKDKFFWINVVKPMFFLVTFALLVALLIKWIITHYNIL